MPVMRTSDDLLKLVGRVGYIAGGFDGYTESGNIGVLSVGAQNYGLLNASLELNNEYSGHYGDGRTYKFTSMIGMYTQSNVGGSTVPVTVFDFAGGTGYALQGVAANTDTVFGAKASIGMETPITQTVHVGGTLKGNVTNDGGYGGAAMLNLAAKF